MLIVGQLVLLDRRFARVLNDGWTEAGVSGGHRAVPSDGVHFMCGLSGNSVRPLTCDPHRGWMLILGVTGHLVGTQVNTQF